ncbi:ABC transporter substrate-binding protein [Reinekea marina]|uniref:ABC transporter substrate-binding protein n=1 Tax=Reinekea marina TaxID=1310421 RepID=A0ABV7WRC8_9GAMM|nr:ABC transporter substrate-binding protein [Reinekea marina]MDN3647828.1 ABC transporter substrate-binding protein [Reinekea marina]
MSACYKTILIVVMACLFFVACDSNKSEAIPIRIAVSKTPLSSPVYIAHEQGIFEQCGLDVSIIEYAGGLRSFNALVNDKADFATSSDTLVAFKAMEHKDISLIASFSSSDHDTKVLENTSANLGATYRIGYYPDTASEYLMRMYLALSPPISNIELVPLTPEEMMNQWQQGLLNKAVIWEPYVYKIVANNPANTKVVDTKGLYKLSFQMVSRSSILDAKPNSDERMIHAINIATHFIAQNPETAKRMIMNQLFLDDEFMAWDWPNNQFKLNIGRQLLLNAQENARWLKKVSAARHSLSVDASQISRKTMSMDPPTIEDSLAYCENL